MESKQYLKLLDDMASLHKRKNAGYSGKANPDPWANFRGSEVMGVPAWRGCLIRMADKESRIRSLISDMSNEQVGESLRDTLMDLASYALITVCLLEELESD